ncbi:sensor histidine kinase [Paenibacillus sp. MBLB4367]|uniref:sensor histidine kinase n=1 Tax=Paenibacillus sp. MBLB4367 TaxID=3384767 RepID=UPI003907F976
MNIRSKLFITNGAVVVILIVSLIFVMESYARKSILVMLKENAAHSLSQLAENVDNMLKSYEEISDYVYMDDVLQLRLQKKFETYAEAHNDYFEFVRPQVFAIQSSKEMLDINFYTDNPTFHVGNIRPLTDMNGIAEASACPPDGSNRDSMRRWSVLPESGGQGQLRLTQRLNHLTAGSCLFMQIDLNAGKLHNLIMKESEKNRFLIVMPDGVPVLDSMTGGRMPVEADRDWYYSELPETPGVHIVKHDNKEYLLTVQQLDSRSSIRGIRVASLIPLNELEARSKTLLTTSIIFCFLTLIVFMIVNFFVSGRITRRLRQLSARMRQTDMDRLQPIERVKGSDEVSSLSHVFNGMVVRMQRLIREVYESELVAKELQLKTKEAELYALQTQINPHYLYNTLNAIRGNLLEKGDRANAEIVSLLAKSFRQVLGKSGRMVSLEEEINVVETYLKIQAFRYSDRLSYRIEVPESFRELQIPKLSLQTLIENAIVHGLERNEAATLVTVSAERADEHTLRLSVADNGPGMTPERLAEVRQRLEDASQPSGQQHIGLLNVHQRLQSFGPKYGVLLESESGGGASAHLHIPYSTSSYRKEGSA